MERDDREWLITIAQLERDDPVEAEVRKFRRFFETLWIVTDEGLPAHPEWTLSRELFVRFCFQMRYEVGWIAACLLKARQGYMSTTTQALILYFMVNKPHTRALTISHTNEAASHLAGDMSIYMAQHLGPEFAKSVGPKSKDEEQLLKFKTNWKGIEGQDKIFYLFENHSSGRTQSARSVKNPRGNTFYIIHMSEVAFYFEDMNSEKKADELVTALMPTVPFGKNPDACVIMESTANGAKGIFHQTYQQSKKEIGHFRPFFLPWYIIEKYQRETYRQEEETFEKYRGSIRESDYDTAEPYAKELNLGAFEREVIQMADERLTYGNIEWMRHIGLPEMQGDLTRFCQEFPTTDTQAFLSTGTVAFASGVLERYIEKNTQPIFSGTVELDEKTLTSRRLAHGSSYRIYIPYDKDHEYLMGCDPAAGDVAGNIMGDQNDSAIAVLDRMTGEEVAVFNSSRPNPTDFARIAYAIGSEWGFPPSIADREGPGWTFLEELQRLKYPRLYQQEVFDFGLKTHRLVLGFRTTEDKKRAMYHKLRHLFKSEVVKVYDLLALEQLQNIVVRNKNGKEFIGQATKAVMDDLNSALALAVSCFRETNFSVKEQKVQDRPDPRGTPVKRADGSILFWRKPEVKRDWC